MRINDRLRRLERKTVTPQRDEDVDGFIAALLGEDIGRYQSKFYGTRGWDAVGLLSELAKEDWKTCDENDTERSQL